MSSASSLFEDPSRLLDVIRGFLGRPSRLDFKHCQRVPGSACVGVVGAKDSHLDGEHVPVFPLGLLILAPLGEHPGDLMPGGQRAVVVGAGDSVLAVPTAPDFRLGRSGSLTLWLPATLSCEPYPSDLRPDRDSNAGPTA